MCHIACKYRLEFGLNGFFIQKNLGVDTNINIVGRTVNVVTSRELFWKSGVGKCNYFFIYIVTCTIRNTNTVLNLV